MVTDSTWLREHGLLTQGKLWKSCTTSGVTENFREINVLKLIDSFPSNGSSRGVLQIYTIETINEDICFATLSWGYLGSFRFGLHEGFLECSWFRAKPSNIMNAWLYHKTYQGVQNRLLRFGRAIFILWLRICRLSMQQCEPIIGGLRWFWTIQILARWNFLLAKGVLKVWGPEILGRLAWNKLSRKDTVYNWMSAYYGRLEWR